MWNIDVEDYCLAGVHSPGFEKISEAVRDWINGSNNKTFINAGVMIMNLDKIRERGNLFQNAMKWIEKRVHLMKFSDQDVINNIFYGSIKLIDRKFNNGNPTKWEQLPDSIIHTPHPYHSFKTWGIQGLPSQQLYWKYYTRTAWGDDVTLEDFAETMLESAKKSSSCYNHSIPQYMGLVSWKIIRKVFYTNELVLIIRYLVSEAYHRLKQKLSPSR